MQIIYPFNRYRCVHDKYQLDFVSLVNIQRFYGC